MKNKLKSYCVLIVGFNNWGKTTLIYKLFDRKRFYYGRTYHIQEVNIQQTFTVESASNDDLWGQRWINQINRRLDQAPSNNRNLFSAICPTMHNNNNFTNLLQSQTFRQFDKVYLFLIKNKFEHHAKLRINKIIDIVQNIPNINCVEINADDDIQEDSERLNVKLNQIRTELINLIE